MSGPEAAMKKFNNTLEGTDCGDAGLPARWRDAAKAKAKTKTILRLVPKTPDAGSVVVIQFLDRRDGYGTRAALSGEFKKGELR
jgi:hypothetical protein